MDPDVSAKQEIARPERFLRFIQCYRFKIIIQIHGQKCIIFSFFVFTGAS